MTNLTDYQRQHIIELLEEGAGFAEGRLCNGGADDGSWKTRARPCPPT